MVVTISLWKLVMSIIFIGVACFYLGYEHRILVENLDDEDEESMET